MAYMVNNMAASSVLMGIILLIALPCLAQGLPECTNATVTACLKPVSDFDIEVNGAIVPTLNETTMREHCRRYDLFSDCMDPIRPYCGKGDQLLFEGIDDAYNYLCHETFDEYVKHRDCLNNPYLHREGQVCNDTLSDRIKELPTYAPSTSYKLDRYCQYAEDYLDCVENTVKYFCGQEAASWQRGLDARSLEPLLDAIGCARDTGPRGSSTGSGALSPVMVGILASVGLIILGIAITVLLILFSIRKRKLQARNQMQDVHNGPYVSYNGPNGAAVMMPPSGGFPEAGPLPEKMLPPPYDGADPPPYVQQLSVDDLAARSPYDDAHSVAGSRYTSKSGAPSRHGSLPRYSEMDAPIGIPPSMAGDSRSHRKGPPSEAPTYRSSRAPPSEAPSYHPSRGPPSEAPTHRSSRSSRSRSSHAYDNAGYARK